MATVSLPAIEASSKPSALDCMSAEASILQQIGGVAPIAAEIVAGVNDKIDFLYGASYYAATLSPGKYVSDSALLAAVEAALVAQVALTWVATLTATRRVQITVDEDVSLLFDSGANEATSARDVLGFGVVDTPVGTTHTAGAALPDRTLRAMLGNLDAANIASGAGFTNAQKREPYSRAYLWVPVAATARNRLTWAPAANGMIVDGAAIATPVSTGVDFRGRIVVHAMPSAATVELLSQEAKGADSSGIMDSGISRFATWRLATMIPKGSWLWAEMVPDTGYAAWVGNLLLWGRTLHGG